MREFTLLIFPPRHYQYVRIIILNVFTHNCIFTKLRIKQKIKIYDELNDVQYYLSLWNRILPAEFCWRQSSRGWCPCSGHGLDLSCTRPWEPPSPPWSHLYWSEELWFQPICLDERRHSGKQVLHFIKLTHLRCLIEKKNKQKNDSNTKYGDVL